MPCQITSTIRVGLLKDRELCAHCGQSVKKWSRRRLCARCYAQPGTRKRYPPRGPKGRRMPKLRGNKRPLPARPTQALPGTAAKIAVLTERASKGQQLFHPDDSRWSLL